MLVLMQAPDPFPPADPLGEALHFLRMNGTLLPLRTHRTVRYHAAAGAGVPLVHVLTSDRIRLETGEEERSWITTLDASLTQRSPVEALQE
jgi:hypothetical protein